MEEFPWNPKKRISQVEFLTSSSFIATDFRQS